MCGTSRTLPLGLYDYVSTSDGDRFLYFFVAQLFGTRIVGGVFGLSEGCGASRNISVSDNESGVFQARH